VKRGSLPITIGITGHRDVRPEDMPVIEESLHKVFRDIGRMCPHSPIYIITALAEGADRIAAKVALDLGMRIIAPLPMRRELYEKDFSSPESMVEFEELLSESEEWFELPLLDGAEEKDIIVMPGIISTHSSAPTLLVIATLLLRSGMVTPRRKSVVQVM
jgi:hypothetical protein